MVHPAEKPLCELLLAGEKPEAWRIRAVQGGWAGKGGLTVLWVGQL